MCKNIPLLLLMVSFCIEPFCQYVGHLNELEEFDVVMKS